MKLEQLEALAARGNDLAVIDGPSAVGLVAAAGLKEREKVKAALLRVEVKLGVCPGERWTKDSDEYQCGLEALKQLEVQRSRAKVGKLVVEVRQNREKARRNGVTSAISKQRHKAESSRRRRIDVLLREMYIWQCFGSGQHPDSVALTEELIKVMLQGSCLPWADVAAGADVTAMQLYHGRLYHTAFADHARLAEEERWLRVEKVRLLRRLELRVELLDMAVRRAPGGEHVLLAGFEAQRQTLLVAGGVLEGCARDSAADGRLYALAHHLACARAAVRDARTRLGVIPAISVV